MLVYPLSSGSHLAMAIAKKAGARLGKILMKRFPDGELYLRFLDNVKGKNVVLVQSLYPEPDRSLLELVFAARTARDLGAGKVTGIVPYMAYMRQDARFNKGECVSNRIIASLLDKSLDRLLTIDPHLHRVHNIAALFRIKSERLSANNSIAKYIQKKFSPAKTIIAGPDIESSQWAKNIAESIGFDSVIFLKKRYSPRHVRIRVTHEPDWQGKDIVIVDDIISSGHTMIGAVKEIKKRKPHAIHCICIHGIFAEGAYEKLGKAGAKSVVSTNTVRHKSNKIDIAAETAAKL